MTIGKDLEKQLAADNEKEKVPASTISQMIGMTAAWTVETIIGDIEAMIEKGYRPSLEGYIFCLSRIMQHEKAWQCIVKAFSHKGEIVPPKYYKQFGQTEENIIPVPKQRVGK